MHPPALDKPVLLIDGDILAYRAASATDGRQYEVKYKQVVNGNEFTVITLERYKKDADKRKEDAGDAFISMEQTWDPEPDIHAFKIIKDALISLERNLEEHIGGPVGIKQICLSRGGSFRERECPSYKSNREDMRRPANLEACKDYLIKHHDALCIAGEFEADDLMAMTQGPNSVICSVDKDLLQIPGYHFNFVKNIFSYVEEIEGWRNLYTQVLTGDDSDGIVGIYGIGPAKAKKILAGLSTPFLMYTAVLRAYLEHTPKIPGEHQDVYHNRVISMVHMNAHLLYLCRHLGDRWKEPVWE